MLFKLWVAALLGTCDLIQSRVKMFLKDIRTATENSMPVLMTNHLGKIQEKPYRGGRHPLHPFFVLYVRG